MKTSLIAITFILCNSFIIAQGIYIVNNDNEIKIINPDLSITDVITVEFDGSGDVLTDIAFSPNGKLYGITGLFKNIVNINLFTGSIEILGTITEVNNLTSLVGNSENKLIAATFFSDKLVTFNLNDNTYTVENIEISSPGDLTFLKGNLIYPNSLSMFVRSYDGNSFQNISCSIPLTFGFVNVFEDCDNNQIYGIDEDSKLYTFDFVANEVVEIADLFLELGGVNGAATQSEFMASACITEIINNGVDDNCEPILGTYNFHSSSSIYITPNPVSTQIKVSGLNKKENFEIYDILGVKIKYGELSNNEHIEVSNFTAGLYFLKIMNYKTVKFLKY